MMSLEVLGSKFLGSKLLEVSYWKFLAPDFRRHHHCARNGAPHAHRIGLPLNSTQILPYVAVNKDALPDSPAIGAGCIKSLRLPKQAQVSRVSFQAQYLAFIRSTAGSSAAL